MDERIENARNRVFNTSNGIAVGKNIEYSLHTNSDHVYRITGMNQIKDIIACGYVRPKSGKLKGGHENEIFWSLGSDRLFYYDRSGIVLEASTNSVHNDQIGAIPIEDLTGIWVFDAEKNQFVNKLDFYMKVYEETHNAYDSHKRK